MATSLLMTSTSEEAPLDGSKGDAGGKKQEVSDFLTIQSLTNFSAMTGAISAAWLGLQKVMPTASALLVPYIFALAWGAISILISLDGLKKEGKFNWSSIAAAIFIALINSLVLASAVIGAVVATSPSP